jgi:hypothetical protein
VTGRVPDSRSATRTPQRRPGVARISPERVAVRSALWSVYYHTFHRLGLRGSVLRQNHPFQPIALADAIRTVANASDAMKADRQRRVADRLLRAGFGNETRLTQLRAKAVQEHDSAWLARLDETWAAMQQLVTVLGLDAAEIAATPVHAIEHRIYPKLLAALPGCVPSAPSLVACQVPQYNGTPHPMTTVEASAILPKTPVELARTFDPRSWGTCFEHFETDRVEPADAKGDYPTFYPDPDPIGEPWDPAQEPHLFWERITLQDLNSENVFENILRITSFSVTPTWARLEFTLHESRLLEIPALGTPMRECVKFDEGHLEATLLSPAGGTAMSRVQMVKRVQFVDLSLGGSNNPMGWEGGEILNYLAPACLCMWLEDLTQGAVCCAV